MTNSVSGREARRLAVQAELDAARNQPDRNRMGQFATPTELAVEMLQYAKTELDDATPVRFIDPAIGTGSFYSALLRVFPEDRVTRAVGYEIDPHYGQPAFRLWQGTALDLCLQDFTLAPIPSEGEKFNLVICNPPYVRHHHIDSQAKRRLKTLAWKAGGIEVNGLAGLYCYFLGLAHPWMVEGGLAGWLIPSEFMDVNYGVSVKRYLLERVTLLHIHRFDPNEVQFRDALVSSAVVWFSKQAPPPGHRVRMTFGGSQLKPALERWVHADTLRGDPKWTRYPMKESHARLRQPVLADFFTIKRGLVTGGNSYFILSGEEIGRRGLPAEMFQPILPGPRHLPTNEVLDAALDDRDAYNCHVRPSQLGGCSAGDSASIDDQALTADKVRVIAEKKCGRSNKVVRLLIAPQGSPSGDGCLPVPDALAGQDALAHGQAGGDGVDPNVLWPKFADQRASHRQHPALGCVIVEQTGISVEDAVGGYHDD